MRTGRAEALLTHLARRFGVSVGQAYTVASGAAVAVLLAAFGLPPVLDGVERPPTTPRDLEPWAAAVDDAAPIDDDLAGDLAVGLAPVVRAGAAAPSLTARPTDTPVVVGPVRGTTVPPVSPGFAPVAVGATRRFAAVGSPGAPAGVAVGPDGVVYVTTDNADGRGTAEPSRLLAFDPDGTLVDSWAVDGQVASGSHGLTDVAVDVDGEVWVLDGGSARVMRLDRASDSIEPVAVVPDLPACSLGLVTAPCEPGVSDAAPEPRGLAPRAGGGVLVADRAQGIVWSVTTGGEVTPVTAIDDRVAGEGPVDVAVLADGSFAVVLSARLGSTPPGLPAVLRVPVVDGVAATPELVADLALDDVPTSVVATSSARLFVALSGVNQIIDLGLEQGDQIRHGAGLDPAFDVPTGLALVDGALLVTNQGPAGSGPDRWAVIAFGVADRPVATND